MSCGVLVERGWVVGKAICRPGSQPAEVLCKLCLDPRIFQRNGGLSPVRTVCWSILPNIFERVVSFSEVWLFLIQKTAAVFP
jgi:hypothetical protein